MKKWIEKAKYRFDQFLSKGTVSLVLSLFLLMFVIVLVIGIVIFVFSPEADFGQLIWISFMQTLDPGNLSGETGNLLYMIMMTLATIVGIFITSLFISFILNGFQTRLENLRRGKSKVIETGHSLILGWSENIYTIIDELIEANLSLHRPVIVILSDMDSVLMNELIRDHIQSMGNTRIICRTGSIFKQKDLDMCNINKARSVIINEDDLNTIKSLLVVVNTDFYDQGNAHISALMYDPLNIDVAKNIGKDRLEVICLGDAITRIIAQTCLQPGLSCVYNELLEFKGDEIYFYSHPDTIGKSFKEIVLSFERSVPIGIVRNQKTLVNPDKDTIIETGDQLILITEDEDTAVYRPDGWKVDDEAIVTKNHRSSVKQHQIFVIGFNRKTVAVIQEFDLYLAKGSKIQVLVNTDAYFSEIRTLDEKLGNIELEMFSGETYKRDVLEKYINASCESIIIFANEDVANEDQDSQTLMTLLHLRDMEEKLDTRFDIIAEISDVTNSEIVDLAKVDDFIISELIANKMLVQVSENRQLKAIFDHLLSDEGSEIYLKPMTDYVKATIPVNFYTLSQAALSRQEIAIGYKRYNEDGKAEIDLNPNKQAILSFGSNDFLIVISEN